MVEFEELGIDGNQYPYLITPASDGAVKSLWVRAAPDLIIGFHDHRGYSTCARERISVCYYKSDQSLPMVSSMGRDVENIRIGGPELSHEDCHFISVQSLIFDGIKKHSKQEAP